MKEVVSVMASTNVGEGCPMYGLVYDSECVSFTFGRHETLDVGFNAPSLRQFVRLATDALRELEQRQAEIEAGDPEREGRTRVDITELVLQ